MHGSLPMFNAMPKYQGGVPSWVIIVLAWLQELLVPKGSLQCGLMNNPGKSEDHTNPERSSIRSSNELSSCLRRFQEELILHCFLLLESRRFMAFLFNYANVTWAPGKGVFYKSRKRSVNETKCLYVSEGSPSYMLKCQLPWAEDLPLKVWAKKQVIHSGVQTDLAE